MLVIERRRVCIASRGGGTSRRNSMNLEKMSPAAEAAKRLRSRKLLTAAVLVAASAGPGQAAITPSDVNAWQHIVDCAGALFSNPEEHALYCGPGRAAGVTFGSFFISPS